MINAKKVKEMLSEKVSKVHATEKDIINICKAYEKQDYSEIHKGKLYNKHGGEYCQLLEILNKVDYKVIY